MLRRFENKVAMVTGAGQGIGRAIASRLGEEGAAVAVVDLSEAGAAATVDGLRAAGVKAEAVIADLSTFRGAQDAAHAVIDQFDRIDVLINNVGGTMSIKPFWEYTEQEIVDEVGRSLWTTVWTCRAVVPHMLGNGAGSIVNLGSTSPRGPFRVPYATAKGGVFALTSSMAIELAQKGVRVNCVAPGATRVGERVVPRGRPGEELTEEQNQWRAELFDYFKHQIPMGRHGVPTEQAAAVAFMASDDASFITGQILVCGGGAIV